MSGTAVRNGTSAKALLRGRRFARGVSAGPARLSPRFSREQTRAIARRLAALPPRFAARLPRLRIAGAERLWTPAGGPAHAASFIPQRYMLLADPLFRHPHDLGRILYHELCHFLWPRMARGRRVYESTVARELRTGARGELGYAAVLAKETLGKSSARRRDRHWRHYLCESFCDTGALFLLRAAGRGRRRPSDCTLHPRFWPARFEAWQKAFDA